MKSSCRLQVKPKLWKNLQTSAEMQYLFNLPLPWSLLSFQLNSKEKKGGGKEIKKGGGNKSKGLKWNEMFSRDNINDF